MSTTQPPNVAAIIETEKTQVKIITRPIPQPGPDELLVRNYAVAANPVDWKIQAWGGSYFDKYPNVLGSDVAGVVQAVGTNATHFQVGDRVTGFAAVIYNREISHGAWQTYTLLRTIATTKLPAHVSFAEGSVIPMGFATAACALFGNLELPRPSITPADKSASSQILLVWGGASSVGSSTIQLAKNSGLKVFVTASAKHEEYLKSLGADAVFDYHDSAVVKNITEASKRLGTKITMVVDTISEGDTFQLTADVLTAGGEGGKLVTTLPWPAQQEKPRGLEVLFCIAGSLGTERAELGQWLFNEYLEGALANGSVVSAPPVEIISGGIAATQKVWDLLKAGVSGKKLVVEL